LLRAQQAFFVSGINRAWDGWLGKERRDGGSQEECVEVGGNDG